MSTHPRRWFQFRLRTLLIAVAVLAVPCAWVGYSLRWIRQRHQAPVVYHVNTFSYHHNGGAPGGLWIFGEQAVSFVFTDGDWCLTEQEVAELRVLFPEADVDPEALPVQLPARLDLYEPTRR